MTHGCWIGVIRNLLKSFLTSPVNHPRSSLGDVSAGWADVAGAASGADVEWNAVVTAGFSAAG